MSFFGVFSRTSFPMVCGIFHVQCLHCLILIGRLSGRPVGCQPASQPATNGSSGFGAGPRAASQPAAKGILVFRFPLSLIPYALFRISYSGGSFIRLQYLSLVVLFWCRSGISYFAVSFIYNVSQCTAQRVRPRSVLRVPPPEASVFFPQVTQLR